MPSISRALIVFLGLVAFLPALRLGFQLDDHVAIVRNTSIRHWDYQTLKAEVVPARNAAGELYYRPMQAMMNRLQYQVWGLRPFGYHLTNLLLHLGNALLVFELMMLLSFPAWCSLAVGCLFAVHPIIVSELMMASGIPELMSLFFTLASLLLLLKPNSRWLWPGLLLYAMALLSKESAIVLPLYVALVSWSSKDRRMNPRLWMGLVLVTLGYAALRIYSLGAADAFPLHPSIVTFLGTRFPTILLRYGALVLFPWHLHAYRLIPLWNPLWSYGVGLLLWACYQKGGRPAWARVAVAWLLISLLPKIPLMATGHYMLEHWAYPGLIGLLLPIGMLLTRGWTSSKPLARGCATGVFATLLCFCVFSARFHLIVRSTDEANYRWSLQFTRATPLLFNLGLLCLQTGRAVEAVHYIQPVHALYPNDPVISRAMTAAQAAAKR